MATYPSLTITASIDAPPESVCRYASDPTRLPEWAAGLANGITKIGDEWIAASPMGNVAVAFAGANNFGVLDHRVRLPDGTDVLNPMRVIPNGSGSEILFTLFRRPGMSDADFDRDAALVRSDLQTLKRLLEKRTV